MTRVAWAAFVAAGAVGAALRYLVEGWAGDRWGTFAVNVTGSVLFGFLTGLSLYSGFHETPLVVLGAGFCGAYTTFSGFAFETVRLAEDDDVGAALRSAAGMLVACVAGAGAGLALAGLR